MTDHDSAGRQHVHHIALVDVPCPICGYLPGFHDPDGGVLEGHHVLCGFGAGVLPEAVVRGMLTYLDDPDALISLAVELRAAADTWTVALADLDEDPP